MKYVVVASDTEAVLAELDSTELDTLKFARSGHDVQVRSGDGQREVVPVYSTGSQLILATALGNFRVNVVRGGVAGSAGGARSAHKYLKSSMPGKILKVLCEPGAKIEAGQPLLIVEAMKMENEIRAPQHGTVSKISVSVGQKVETGELLLEFDAD